MSDKLDRADFIDDEILGGLLLFVAAAVAMVWANSPWSDAYFELWETQLTFGLGDATIELDLQHWINDLLMALFFFVVGLEIKRELVSGELRDGSAARLPAIAAFGGVALPAVLFLLIVGPGSEEARGWAIPVATDIAFAVGALARLGSRVSSGMRLLLLTIAIVDDIIAIAIIALFYAEGVSLAWLAVAGGGLLGILAFQRFGIWRPLAYVPLALVVWIGTYESGIHATIAGVVLGLLVPARPFRGRDVHAALEHSMHPISAYFVVPLFALANAGVHFGGIIGEALSSKLTWAIVAGLVLGKLFGITAATMAALRTGAGRLPDGMSPRQIAGVGAFAGIGFTVSLFIADLAFTDPALVDEAKIGIFIGSAASGLLGALLVLRLRRAEE